MGNSNRIESELKNYIKDLAEKCFEIEVGEVNVEHPEKASHGDFSTNICLVLAPRLKQSPIELAKKLVYEMSEEPLITKIGQRQVQIFNSVEVAEPGFINFFFKKHKKHT